MPELPEVETIARGLNALVADKVIKSAKVHYPGIIHGNPGFFISNIRDKRIVRVRRRAKLLIFDLEGPLFLVFHLKMTGRVWMPENNTAPCKHTHIVFRLGQGKRLFFEDQRKFGYSALLTFGELAGWKFFSNLGPEPLEITADQFVSIFKHRKARIKSLLLDQKVIAGIGNIYADESLFMAGIHPKTPAYLLSVKELNVLYICLQKVLLMAIDSGGSSFKDYRNALGQSGLFQENFLVYGRRNGCCPSCGTDIDTCRVAGRTSWTCPSCQVLSNGKVIK